MFTIRGGFMQTIAIITNKKKDTDGKITKKCEELLKDKYNLIFSNGTQEDELKKILSQCQSAIVIGGDGTILLVAGVASSLNVPILGINMGNMGFLADVEPTEIESALESFTKGDYSFDERFMIEASVKEKGTAEKKTLVALNDLVISRASYTRMIALDIFVDSQFAASYVGDGVVVSTPTGSTAYSLSAGGPIVDSSLDVCIITPVCPHSLGAKPMIVHGNSEISIRFHANFDDISMLTSDGHKSIKISDGDEITINASSLKTRLIKISNKGFFEIFNKKL